MKGLVCLIVAFLVFLGLLSCPVPAARAADTDTTPPVTTDNGGLSWHGAPYWLTLEASDLETGVAQTRYKVDDATTWATYLAPVLLTTHGDHCVQYQSQDNAGNWEEVKICRLRIDAMPPTSTSRASGIWSGSPVTVSVSADDGGRAWAWQSIPFDAEGIAFANALDGWVVGAGGAIASTTDGGLAWHAQASGTTNNLYDVSFIDDERGWAVGEWGTVVATVDGGAHWLSQQITPYTLSGVDFVDADRGWAVGGWTIWCTTDGGATWSIQAQVGQTLRAVDFYDSARGCAVGSGGGTYYTADGGLHWTASGAGVLAPLYDVCFYTPTDVCAVGGEGTVIRSSTGGASWAGQSPMTGTVTGVDFVDEAHGWIVGSNGQVKVTWDGGRTWYSRLTSETTALRAIDMVDESHGFVAADCLALSYVENGSGVAAIYTNLDSGAWTDASTVTIDAPADGSNDGPHTVGYWSVDVVGNVESTKSVVVNIDTQPPSTTDDASGQWRNWVCLTSVDAGVGVGGVYYRVDGGTWQLQPVSKQVEHTYVMFSPPADGSADGPHHVEYYAVDKLWHFEPTVKSCTVYVDGSPPIAWDDAPSGWCSEGVTVHLGFADVTSWVQGHTYFTDEDGGVSHDGDTVYVAAPNDGSNDGEHTFGYFAWDAANNFSEFKSFTVRIDTTPPNVTATADRSGWTNGDVAITIDGSDASSGLEGVYYRVDDGDVQRYAGQIVLTNGQHTISYWSKDNAGLTSYVDQPPSLAVQIDRIAPVTTATVSQGSAGDSATVDLSGADDGGSGIAETRYAIGSGEELLYNGEFTVTGPQPVTVWYWSSDAAGNVEARQSMEVQFNRPPSAVVWALACVVEGDSVTFDASASTDPDGDSLTCAWDLDGDGDYDDGNGATLSTSAVDNGTLSASVRVTDAGGLSDTAEASVEIDNAPPRVNSIVAPLDPVAVGTPVPATARFSDAGILDTHTASWEWDDGATSAGTVTEASGCGFADGTHAYSSAGVYIVKLTLTDKDGAIATGTSEYVVVYDPNCGFVTGGGWITSQPGAYPANPDLGGMAGFGFVSKYQKGASVPSGTTQFQFHADSFSFHSDSYEWLVVNKASTNAQYKGSGTVNGALAPNGKLYKFMLWAYDGSNASTTPKPPDAFRIKIWYEETPAGLVSETVVYDNGVLADGSEPYPTGQPLSGGSIVVHK